MGHSLTDQGKRFVLAVHLVAFQVPERQTAPIVSVELALAKAQPHAPIAILVATLCKALLSVVIARLGDTNLRTVNPSAPRVMQGFMRALLAHLHAMNVARARLQALLAWWTAPLVSIMSRT